MVYNEIEINDKNYSILPVGTILPLYTNHIPNGYLLCDGSRQKCSEFPRLKQILGYGDDDYFYLPDLRECALVGIGKNTTDVDYKMHDEFEIGQYKDDNLGFHRHRYKHVKFGDYTGVNEYVRSKNDNFQWTSSINSVDSTKVRDDDVTRGKRFGVNFIIKY